jgi:hypothetical protein
VGEQGHVAAGTIPTLLLQLGTNREQVADDTFEAVLVGEVPEVIVAAGSQAVAAVVVGPHGVASPDQDSGQPRVAPGVLGHPVGDLDDRPGLAVGAPSADVHSDAVSHRQVELVEAHA